MNNSVQTASLKQARNQFSSYIVIFKYYFDVKLIIIVVYIV